MRALRLFSILSLAVFGLMLSAKAAPPKDFIRPPQHRAAAVLDYDTYIDANRILAFVNNDGSLFTDYDGMFGRTDGFYYPYYGISGIVNGSTDNTVIYTAGLWMGGKVNGQVRVSVAEYYSEFAAGPMINGGPAPDWESKPEFRVYSLHSDSLIGHPNADYLNWPVDQGAPLDGSGYPLVMGDQAKWTVFNDADPSLHQGPDGGTDPLGIEVRQYAFAYDRQGIMGDELFLQYTLYNRGGNYIDSFYFSFWADPDLGDPTDDLIGCDSVTGDFYCYNGDNSDYQYGSQPPAWGGRVVAGPVVPSSGNQAYFNMDSLSNLRNTKVSSIAKYINGTDPASAQQVFNCMKGLYANGSPHMYGGLPRRFMCSGDPVAGVGDLDENPSDRRIMVTCGPVVFAPGDSQQVFIKFAVIQGLDRLNSLQALRLVLDYGEIAPPTCCQGTTGNADCNANGEVAIDDLVAMINVLFLLE